MTMRKILTIAILTLVTVMTLSAKPIKVKKTDAWLSPNGEVVNYLKPTIVGYRNEVRYAELLEEQNEAIKNRDSKKSKEIAAEIKELQIFGEAKPHVAKRSIYEKKLFNEMKKTKKYSGKEYDSIEVKYGSCPKEWEGKMWGN